MSFMKRNRLCMLKEGELMITGALKEKMQMTEKRIHELEDELQDCREEMEGYTKMAEEDHKAAQWEEMELMLVNMERKAYEFMEAKKAYKYAIEEAHEVAEGWGMKAIADALEDGELLSTPDLWSVEDLMQAQIEYDKAKGDAE